MIKFMYIQDVHLRIKNPTNRTDNYYEAMMVKMEEICQIYQKENCDYLISGGDTLDIPLVSYTLVDDFIDLIEKYDVKMKIVWGNHDEIAGCTNNSKGTSLAHMIRRSKNIEVLTSLETDDEIIQGYDYYFGIEDDINEKGLICNTEGKHKIAIVHALICEKPFFKEIPHNVIGKFKTNYDQILIAHNHKEWGNKKIGETEFINIGCLGRRKVDEFSIDPSYLIYETGKPIRIEKLKTAKKGEEIFDLVSYKEKKETKNNINDFIEMINDTKFQEMDLMAVIQKIAEETNTSKDVIDCIIEKIGELENEKIKVKD